MRKHWQRGFIKKRFNKELSPGLTKAYATFLIKKLRDEYKKSDNILYGKKIIAKSGEPLNDIIRWIYLNNELYFWIRQIIIKHSKEQV